MFRFLSCLLLLGQYAHSFSQTHEIQVYSKQTETGMSVFATNETHMPFTIILEVMHKRMIANDAYPKQILVNPGQIEMELTALNFPERGKWKFDFQYGVIVGDANAKHDDSYIYDLPYAKGESYQIAQGYQGTVSHQGRNSLDFSMPIGTKVFAAREGTVVEIKEDSNQGCPQERCKPLGNHVIILQPDGSFAEYYHFKQDGVEVKMGQKVSKGELIGYSGNTGWSTGPHLHFQVYINGLQYINSLPTKFKVGEKVSYLKESETYKRGNQ